METTAAQPESMMLEQPQKEHHWLQKMVGEWTYETEVEMGPDHPHETFSGTESVRTLGGFWVVAEGQGEMPCCGIAQTIMTLGYDPKKQQYIGTWIGSMMTYLWVYEGELDAEERVLTLNSEGPDMADETKMAQYRDIIEFKSHDHRVMTTHALGHDGQWHAFMTVNYRRQ